MNQDNLYKFDFECMDNLEYCKKLKDGSVKLVLTSPPYNIGKIYEDKIDFDEYINSFEPLVKELVRVLASDGSICWQVGNYINDGEVYPLDIFFYTLFKKYGLKLRNRIIWRNSGSLQCKKRLTGAYETIMWFTKSDDYIFNLDNIRIPSKYPGKKKNGKFTNNVKGKNPTDFWEITVEKIKEDWESLVWDIPSIKARHREETFHPCQFPISLVERCVLALTNEDDVVFDPYAGVASTIIGAFKNNRIGVGCELAEAYYVRGMERIVDLCKGNLRTKEIYEKKNEPKETHSVSKIPVLDKEE